MLLALDSSFLPWKQKSSLSPAHVLSRVWLFVTSLLLGEGQAVAWWGQTGFSVHGILQARILEQVAIYSSRGSSWLRDQTQVSGTGRQILYCWATSKALLWALPGYETDTSFSPRNQSAHRQHSWLTWNFFKGCKRNTGLIFHFPPVPFTQTQLQASLACVCAAHHQGDRNVNTCSLHSPVPCNEGCGEWVATQKCTGRKKGGKLDTSFYWNFSLRKQTLTC